VDATEEKHVLVPLATAMTKKADQNLVLGRLLGAAEDDGL